MLDIETKFVERTATADEEALLVQQVTAARYQELQWQRHRRDRRVRLLEMGEEVDRLVPILRTPLDGGQGHAVMYERLASGLALLIEEIHHLNAGAKQ